MLRAQCHCRPCQYFSGGAANMFMLMPPEGFRYTKGEPRRFKRDDLENAVTREFCGDCGAPIYASAPQDTPTISLRWGSIHQRAQLRPQRMIWCDSAVPFAQNLSGLPSVPRDAD